MTSNSDFFSDKFHDVPKFPFDDDGQFDDVFIKECPNCDEDLEDHSPQELVRCALQRLQGVPH